MPAMVHGEAAAGVSRPERKRKQPRGDHRGRGRAEPRAVVWLAQESREALGRDAGTARHGRDGDGSPHEVARGCATHPLRVDYQHAVRGRGPGQGGERVHLGILIDRT